MQALKRTVQPCKEPITASPADDFSIVALTAATPHTTASSRQSLSSKDLLKALLHAAVAFSTSQQLSEQLLAAGILTPIAVLLNEGSVHNHDTCLTVELLWNLLEACPVSDTQQQDAATYATRCLPDRHSQIIKPRQAHPLSSSHSLREREHEAGNDDHVSVDGHESTAAAELDLVDGIGHTDEGTMQTFPHSAVKSSCSHERVSADDRPDSSSSAASRASRMEADAESVTNDTGSIAGGDTQDAIYDDAGSAAHITREGSLDPLPAATDSVVDSYQSGSNSQAGEEISPAASVSEVVPPEPAPSALEQDIAAGVVKLLADCLEHGHSTADKDFRNTLLVVAGMLAESKQYRHALCCHEMLQQLLIASTEPELGDCSDAHLKVCCCLILPSSLKGMSWAVIRCAYYAAPLHKHKAGCLSIVMAWSSLLLPFTATVNLLLSAATCHSCSVEVHLRLILIMHISASVLMELPNAGCKPIYRCGGL